MKNKERSSITQLSIMIFITMITQLFILVRASIVASNFGVSVELDAFNFANSLSTLVFGFIGAGITTVLIPNLGEKEKNKSVNTFISVLFIVATTVLIIMIIFRNPIIGIFNRSSNSYFTSICSNVSIILLISQYLASFVGLSNAILQYKGKFNSSKLVVLFTNIFMVILLVFYTGNSINGYAIAVLITSLANVIFQFILVYKSGFKYKFYIELKDRNFRRMIMSFIPTILSTGLYQISLMVDTVIASGLGEGQISILNYSNYIIGMINMLLIVNITSFLYPKIAREVKNENSQKNLSKYITLINAILCFVVVAFIIVGDDMLKILYMRGQFTAQISKIVFYCTILYIVSVPVSALRDIVYKYFYANGNTFTPFKNSLLISILNIIISIFLSQLIGLYGVVIGTTLTSIISLFLISIRFKKNYGIKFDRREFFIENFKIILINIVDVAIFIFIKSKIRFSNSFLNIIFFGIGVFIVYVILLYISRSKVFKIKL